MADRKPEAGGERVPLARAIVDELTAVDGWALLSDGTPGQFEEMRDIDVLVRPDAMGSVVPRTVSALRSRGYRVRQRRRWESIQVYGWNSDGVPSIINVDLVRSLQWRGFEYLSTGVLVSGATRTDAWPTVRPGDYRAYRCLRSTLWAGDPIPDAVLEEAEPAALSWASSLSRGTEADDRGGQELHSQEVRRAVRRGLFLKAPLATVGGVLGWQVARVRSALAPTGFLMALLGPDGSGKSAVARSVLDGLAGTLFNGDLSASIHWRPGILPRPGALRGEPAEIAQEVIENPHGQPPHGLLINIGRALYLWVDYLAGVLRLRTARMARSAIVVFDRYAYDIYVDPARYRFQPGLRPLLRLLFVQLVPRPQLSVVLAVTPAVARERKGETETSRIEQANEGYLALATRPRFTVVDADLPLEEVCRTVERRLLEEYFDDGE